MDSGLVVGVGNIYAAESLFDAGIDPRRAAGSNQPRRLTDSYRPSVPPLRDFNRRAAAVYATTS